VIDTAFGRLHVDAILLQAGGQWVGIKTVRKMDFYKDKYLFFDIINY